jgi:succinate-semialdehyde dehydrogenase/glutarate-semialdehyde dehydrogenase
MDPSTELGPLSSEEALLHLLDQVERSVAAGATVLWVVTDIDGQPLWSLLF